MEWTQLFCVSMTTGLDDFRKFINKYSIQIKYTGFCIILVDWSSIWNWFNWYMIMYHYSYKTLRMWIVVELLCIPHAGFIFVQNCKRMWCCLNINTHATHSMCSIYRYYQIHLMCLSELDFRFHNWINESRMCSCLSVRWLLTEQYRKKSLHESFLFRIILLVCLGCKWMNRSEPFEFGKAIKWNVAIDCRFSLFMLFGVKKV